MLALLHGATAGLSSVEVNMDYVAKWAQMRAESPFRSPRENMPDVLREDNLDYDKYREIRFIRERALWAADKLPFQVEFFHPGYRYQEPVRINEFSYNFVQPIRFVQDFFDYGKLKIQNDIPADTGYAGFRIICALNTPDRMDELGAFLGASYYRLLGKGQRYGASARGLALDCGEYDRPEEFPLFTDWWLGKPAPGDQSVHLFAILDSYSCAGAYEFRITPGETTTADVDAILFFRTAEKIHASNPNLKKTDCIGIAPLTSMFWFGKNSERKFDDYRPEVHDSDGLLMKLDKGETLWRPLNNAPVMRHQKFAAHELKGFGLMQRAREFSDYQDLFNPYHQVPGIWVEPKGRWLDGSVHLVELSTENEYLDNIVAFWEPDKKPAPMEPMRFGYTQYWTRENDRKLSPNRAIATRVGADSRNPAWRQFFIDWKGPKFATLTDDSPPAAIASCSTNAVIVENQVFHLPDSPVWRALIKMEPVKNNKLPVDLRCTMKKGDEILGETWTYLWSPP